MNNKKLNRGAAFNWISNKLLVILLTLRACDVISWPWWIVMVPLWVWLGVVAFGVIAAGITEFAKRVKDGL